MKPVVFDVECYPNYFLVMFRSLTTNRIKYFERLNDEWTEGSLEGLREFLRIKSLLFIGFNSNSYDLPVIAEAIKTRSTNQSIKDISDKIIVERVPHWKLNVTIPTLNHIDLIEPAPAVNTGLKVYGGRLHSPKMQDLPISPDSVITIKDAETLRLYCINDLDITADLYHAIKPRIDLRERLGTDIGQDLRSKSDAQMAEALFRKRLNDLGVSTERAGTSPSVLTYKAPSWITYQTHELKELLSLVQESKYRLHPATAKLIAPSGLEGRILLNRFKFGMGGLHSQESCQRVARTSDTLLYEVDFASFYPHIILMEGFYPKHLTSKFLKMYSALMQDRLTSKRKSGELRGIEGRETEWLLHDTINNGYKIAINGSFGKLGSKYSFLFSPDLMLQVTITGQLILLMLIEQVEAAGGKVVSANTDGIVIFTHKDSYQSVRDACFNIQLESGIELEETQYQAIYSQSVNNYLAIKPDGSAKGKGLYGEPGLQKSPLYEICSIAVKDYLTKGVPLTETIGKCEDIRLFLAVKKVTGGAVFRGEEIGKVIRFYHSTNACNDLITYVKSGNKVPTSEGCIPLMNLPEDLPADINYSWYVEQARKMLTDLGA